MTGTQTPDPQNTGAHGVGLATVTDDGTVLDTWFPIVKLAEPGEGGSKRLSAAEAAEALGEAGAELVGR